ncbi:MAG: GDP-mannose 4,6-dehydratase, partial [Christensenellaceae bacterium]|nr:GDP-mannose 4,6-dehydratase [Christensenellaceae bacterium]
AAGRLPHLNVFGNDYATVDGTGVRDYVHVVDLAKGHLAALSHLQAHEGVEEVNLGTGRGTSVLQLVAAFEKASGKRVPYVFAPRRSGDIGEFFADTAKAKALYGWQAERGIEQMCADSWNFTEKNPNGIE